MRPPALGSACEQPIAVPLLYTPDKANLVQSSPAVSGQSNFGRTLYIDPATKPEHPFEVTSGHVAMTLARLER